MSALPESVASARDEAAAAVESAIKACARTIEKSMTPNAYGHVHDMAARQAKAMLDGLIQTLEVIGRIGGAAT